MKPLVSICVPIFNGASFLQQCLASIEAQTYEPLEVLLVDDQSSDGSLEIAQRFAATHSNVRLFTNPVRLGLGPNLNECLRLAQGDWIKFVFQDDEVTSDCIEKMEEAGGTDFPFVVCNRKYEFLSAEAWRIEALTYLKRLSARTLFLNQSNLSPEEFTGVVFETQRLNFVGEPVAVMFRSSLAKKLGGFDERLIQLIDYELWARIGTNYGVRVVDEELATFRVHAGAASAANWRLSHFRASIVDPLLFAWSLAFREEFERYRRSAPNARSAQRSAKELAAQVQLLARLMSSGSGLARKVAQLIGRSNDSFVHYMRVRLARGEARKPDPFALDAWDQLVSSAPDLGSLSAVTYATFLQTEGFAAARKIALRIRK